MAKLILTGMHEAINLKALDGNTVQQLDEHVYDLTQRNGGFAELLIELRRGICTLLRINESYPLKHKQRIVP